MDAQPTITVTPIYGWGWTVAGKPRFEVPAPFTMRLERAEPKRWAGVVLDVGHEFQHQRIYLSQGHKEWDGHANVSVGSSEPTGQSSHGFALLEGHPSAD